MILLGIALGLLLACMLVGARAARGVYERQLDTLEPPTWVNDAYHKNHWALWEAEIGERQP